MEEIYYSPSGYWHGEAAVTKLAQKAGVSKKEARDFLSKQPIWQIYQPAPQYIPRAKIAETTPNAMHQADIMYLPHDKVGRKTYKYALCVVDVASRYKECEPLVDKTAAGTAAAIAKIYARGPLTYPNLLQVDSGTEFMGEFAELMRNNNTKLKAVPPRNHGSQGIVERFNRTLAERLFTVQYQKELKEFYTTGGENREWVEDLPTIIKELNKTQTRLIGMSPVEAISRTSVQALSSKPQTSEQRIEKPIATGATVRYLYRPGELYEGQERRRATDPIWSLTVHQIIEKIMPTDRDGKYDPSKGPILYGLSDDIYDESKKSPSRRFVSQELLVIPHDTVQLKNRGCAP